MALAEPTAPGGGEQAAGSEPAAAPAAAAPPAANGRIALELEFPVGSTRQAVLDHFLDSEGDQTVAQIMAAMPTGTSKNTAESAIRREYQAGRLLRVAPGGDGLAPP